MRRTRDTIVMVILLAAAILVVGETRRRLDDGRRERGAAYQELLYLPEGNALRVVVFGFDAPAADALWVRSLIYYSDNLRDQNRAPAARQRRTYELFQAITDLSPRFGRAYVIGALFLTSSGNAEHLDQAVRLLDKGVAAFDRMAADGQPATPDIRWEFHMHLANLFETTIQARRNAAGDVDGAREARSRAALEFQLAAASPDCPPGVILAVAGDTGVAAGGSLEAAEAMLAFWERLAEDLERRGDTALLPWVKGEVNRLTRRVDALEATMHIEEILSEAGHLFVRTRGQAPESAEELAAGGFVNMIPPLPLDHHPDFGDLPDRWIFLPDGTARSWRMASAEAERQLDIFWDSLNAWYRAHRSLPPDLDALTAAGYWKHVPEHPLAALGFRYVYRPAMGDVVIEAPEGFVAPEQSDADAKAGVSPQQDHADAKVDERD